MITMTMTLNEAFDKVEHIWGIIQSLERESNIQQYVPEIQDLLKEYHNILLNTTVTI